MGVTVDLIPLLPGEAPAQAIERVYEGGVAIRWDGDTESMTLETIEGDDQPVRQAPLGAFDQWRTEARPRVAELHPWQTATEGSCTYLWSRNSVWQVEIDDESDSITLRARRGWDPDPALPDLDDAELLAAFAGLRTILHWPDAYGTWCDLNDPNDRPQTID